MKYAVLSVALVLMTRSLSFADPISAYQNDDGDPDTLATPFLNFTRYDIQAFQVQAGAETVVGVELMWRSVYSPRPASLHVWIDPTNDGDPHDAVVAGTLDVIVPVVDAPPGTFCSPVCTPLVREWLPLIDYKFSTPLTLQVGSWFFLGTRRYNTPGSLDPFIQLAVDIAPESSPSGRSWGVNFQGEVFGGSLSGGTFFGPPVYQFDYVIRGLAQPAAVPEPGALLLVGLGVAAFVLRRPPADRPRRAVESGERAKGVPQ